MFHVRCMFAGNGRDDAAAVSVADGFDGPLLGQQFADRLRGRHADCVERKGLEPEAGGCDLFYTLSRGSYQRSAGTLLTMGNAERTEPITMIGPKGLERVVTALRTIAPESAVSA